MRGDRARATHWRASGALVVALAVSRPLLGHHQLRGRLPHGAARASLYYVCVARRSWHREGPCTSSLRFSAPPRLGRPSNGVAYDIGQKRCMWVPCAQKNGAPSPWGARVALSECLVQPGCNLLILYDDFRPPPISGPSCTWAGRSAGGVATGALRRLSNRRVAANAARTPPPRRRTHARVVGRTPCAVAAPLPCCGQPASAPSHQQATK